MPQFICPHCGQLIDANDEFAGMDADCPVCEQEVQVPELTQSPKIRLIPLGEFQVSPEPPPVVEPVAVEEEPQPEEEAAPEPAPPAAPVEPPPPVRAPPLPYAKPQPFTKTAGPATAAQKARTLDVSSGSSSREFPGGMGTLIGLVAAAVLGVFLWKEHTLVESLKRELSRLTHLATSHSAKPPPPPAPVFAPPMLSGELVTDTQGWIRQQLADGMKAWRALHTQYDKEMANARFDDLLTLQGISRDPGFRRADESVSMSRQASQRLRHDFTELALTLHSKIESTRFADAKTQLTVLNAFRFGLSRLLPLYEKLWNRDLALVNQANAAIDRLYSMSDRWRWDNGNLLFERPYDRVQFMLTVDRFTADQKIRLWEVKAVRDEAEALFAILQYQLDAEGAETPPADKPARWVELVGEGRAYQTLHGPDKAEPVDATAVEPSLVDTVRMPLLASQRAALAVNTDAYRERWDTFFRQQMTAVGAPWKDFKSTLVDDKLAERVDLKNFAVSRDFEDARRAASTGRRMSSSAQDSTRAMAATLDSLLKTEDRREPTRKYLREAGGEDLGQLIDTYARLLAQYHLWFQLSGDLIDHLEYTRSFWSYDQKGIVFTRPEYSAHYQDLGKQVEAQLAKIELGRAKLLEIVKTL